MNFDENEKKEVLLLKFIFSIGTFILKAYVIIMYIHIYVYLLLLDKKMPRLVPPCCYIHICCTQIQYFSLLVMYKKLVKMNTVIDFFTLFFWHISMELVWKRTSDLVVFFYKYVDCLSVTSKVHFYIAFSFISWIDLARIQLSN